ncbi:unnamed protein product [Caenorhabditis angaria]|uniref:Uncharacterized protein n=1 Tax=Caenorhabditis angaria TaxID=860376 RepID=A0A9P1I9R1_9PELO|nr:unnamed protein product [Caenorhabditis angaria]
MEELFEDLSSISDCDDNECFLKLSTKNNKSFTIQATSVYLICSIPSAYEPETEETTKQKRLEEKSCGTESKNEEKSDKWVQTDETEIDTKSSFADLPPTYREAEYDESALERILRHISAHLHRSQLQQWMSEMPEKNASFHIRPVQAPNIFQATYNYTMVS